MSIITVLLSFCRVLDLLLVARRTHFLMAVRPEEHAGRPIQYRAVRYRVVCGFYEILNTSQIMSSDGSDMGTSMV